MNNQDNIRILIAEDDFLVSERIREIVEGLGYTIVGEAINGRQAVEMTHDLRPDLILMDIKMPDMDGLEAAQMIREQCPTPIVVMTAYHSPELVADANAVGVGAYLLKPPNSRELERVVIIARARFNDMMALHKSNGRLENVIADLKSTQSQLIQQERLAVVGQLASGIAHEYNNAIAAMLLYVDLILKTDSLSSKSEERLEIIRKKGEYAAHLTQQIVDFGQSTLLRLELVDLSSFLQEFSELLSNLLPESIEIHFENNAEGVIINADVVRLKQALMNLALNAQDSLSNKGSILLKLNSLSLADEQPASVSKLEAGEWALITVEDNGCGIASDVLPHIFEPFFSTKIPERSGLGLSQLFGIVKQHKGEVDVKTVEGEGTAVTLYLPALQTITLPQVQSKKQSELKYGNKETILIIAHDTDMKLALKESLEIINYQILIADDELNGQQLLQKYSDQIALMIIEFYMLDKNGIKICHNIRRQFPSMPCIVFADDILNPDHDDHRTDRLYWLKMPTSLSALAAKVASSLEIEKDESD